MVSGYSPLFTLGLLADRCPVRPVQDDASAIYFTFKPGKRDIVELRSFLYLDLADNRLHVPSHRRRFSTLSKSTSWTCTVDAKSVHDLVRTEKSMITGTPPAPVAPARRRTSKESLRNIPSPKPAPSATLPDLPSASPPAPPSLAPKTPPASTNDSSLLLFSPTRRERHPASLRSESISSHDRRKSRMDALACLEGRSRAPDRIPRSTLCNNFMSFSDDEDEKSLSRKSAGLSAPVVEDLSAFADVEDEADPVVPQSRKREAEARPARPAKVARRRRGTIESWFPLKSFIDLKDDDLSSWNWRSFIEIGGVA